MLFWLSFEVGGQPKEEKWCINVNGEKRICNSNNREGANCFGWLAPDLSLL